MSDLTADGPQRPHQNCPVDIIDVHGRAFCSHGKPLPEAVEEAPAPGPADRLARIAEAHTKHVDSAGGTYGECGECGHLWPCPTYQWATAASETVTALCTWDLSDCGFEDHDHSAATGRQQEP